MPKPRRVNGVVYSCGAPGCYVERFQEAGSNVEPVEGLRGSVTEIDKLGGRGDDWWACSREHVAAAILAALEPKDLR